ncbi:MAG: ATP-binding protein [Cyanobacteria bacterium RU_5_0]|nr:ATP-binding protein [Cyanobacteria bacterium RU_5_0]
MLNASPVTIPRFESSQGLKLDSTLRELPLYSSRVEVHCLGEEVARIFNANPLLPGIILTEDMQLVGMISRRRFLEQMGRPYGLSLFFNRSIKTLYEFAHIEFLICSGNVPVVEAAHLTLQRSPELRYEPIVVELAPQVYRLLDFYELLVAQSQIHKLAKQLLHERTQAYIIQTEKMAGFGRIVASVVHEILNAASFITGNLSYLSNYTQTLIYLVNAYESEIPEFNPKLTKIKEQIDGKPSLEALPQLIKTLKMGAERLKEIIRSLRNFAHMDESKREPLNIHDCLDSALLILNSQLRDIEVVKRYSDLPLVNGYSGQLGQVFINIIRNAIDALLEKEAVLKKAPDRLNSTWNPRIEITTSIQSDINSTAEMIDWISVQITDNASGIPLEIQKQIFETFFTTKPASEGAGLGLAISHEIVAQKHGGKLNLKSQPGIGTEFEVLIPLVE